MVEIWLQYTVSESGIIVVIFLKICLDFIFSSVPLVSHCWHFDSNKILQRLIFLTNHKMVIIEKSCVRSYPTGKIAYQMGTQHLERKLHAETNGKPRIAYYIWLTVCLIRTFSLYC